MSHIYLKCLGLNISCCGIFVLKQLCMFLLFHHKWKDLIYKERLQNFKVYKAFVRRYLNNIYSVICFYSMFIEIPVLCVRKVIWKELLHMNVISWWSLCEVGYLKLMPVYKKRKLHFAQFLPVGMFVFSCLVLYVLYIQDLWKKQ